MTDGDWKDDLRYALTVDKASKGGDFGCVIYWRKRAGDAAWEMIRCDYAPPKENP